MVFKRSTKILTSHLSVLMVLLFICSFKIGIAQEKWIAPKEADNLKNPFKNDPVSPDKGKQIFTTYCVVCHGNKGKGDGIGGAGLTPRPTNLTTPNFQSQSDGALFWKLSEGRPPMAPYKTVIPENERWHIINFLRTLKR